MNQPVGLPIKEADVKRTCEHYLTVMESQGKLFFMRLNAGDFIETRGDSRRRIKGAPKGTSDLVVFHSGEGAHKLLTLVTFVECKSSTGKQSPDQVEFEIKVKGHNCRYVIVRSVDELMEVLARE